MYNYAAKRRRIPHRLWMILGVFIAILLIGTVVTWTYYNHNLQPVSSSSKTQYFTIASGSSAESIALQLKKAGLIRSSQAFEWYVASHNDRNKLQAGTYKIAPNQGVGTIVRLFITGKVATDLVTILPGARIDQVREAFIKAGFAPAAVDAALQASQYRGGYPALSDNPSSSNLEGFLFPDSYQKTADTDPKQIIEESLTEMQAHLTPALRNAFAQEGLSTYQGVTLASMLEQEVSKPADRAQAAQVFLKRLHTGMALGSDVTAYYGAVEAGQPASLDYDSPYNTLIHTGLPAGPISSVSDSSLQAAAHPANTDWLYFVTGDDGTTYFSTNLQDHQALAQKYCHKLCSATP
jgi:UPF0755 protein